MFKVKFLKAEKGQVSTHRHTDFRAQIQAHNVCPSLFLEPTTSMPPTMLDHHPRKRDFDRFKCSVQFHSVLAVPLVLKFFIN